MSPPIAANQQRHLKGQNKPNNRLGHRDSWTVSEAQRLPGLSLSYGKKVFRKEDFRSKEVSEKRSSLLSRLLLRMGAKFEKCL